MNKNLKISSALLSILTILSVLVRHDHVLAARILPFISPQGSGQDNSVSSDSPKLSVQTGSDSFSTPVACSPDGSLAVTAHNDGVSNLWDLKTGGEIRRFAMPMPAALPSNWIKAVELTADGKMLFTYDGNNMARFWNITTGQELKSFRGNKEDFPEGAALSPKGDKVLVGVKIFGGSKLAVIARLWDITSQKEVQRFKAVSSGANVVAFSPDGRSILTGEGPVDPVTQESEWKTFKSTDVAARLWDVASGKVIHEFTGHSEGVTSLAYSKSGQTVAVGSLDGTVNVWDVSSGKNLGTFTSEKKESITAIRISEDNSKVITGDDGGHVIVWDVATSKVVKSITLSDQKVKPQPFISLSPTPRPAGVSAFSPDWKLAFTTDTKVWDLETGNVKYSLRSYTNSIITVGLTSDSRSVIVGRGDAQVQIWDLARGRILREFGEEISQEHFLGSEGLKDMLLSPDGEKAYIIKSFSFMFSSDQTVGVWSTSEGKRVNEFKGLKDSTTATLSISLDGRYILAVRSGGFMSGIAYADLWDISSGKRVQSIQAEGSSFISASAISPDNKLIATGETRDWDWLFRSKGITRLWDVSSGKEYKRFVGHSAGVAAVAFSPDGSMLLTGSEDGTARLWHTQGGEIERFTGHTGVVTTVAFSPDMQMVVAGGSDGSIRLWSIQSGKQLQRFDGHTGGVASIKLSADGTKIVSMGTDDSAMLWDIKTGRNIVRLLSMLDGTWVIITPDGRFDTNNLEGIKGLNWVMPDDLLHALPLEIFMRDYYEPRLLSRILKDNKLPTQPPIAELNRVQPKVGKITVTPQAGKSDLVDVTVEVSSVSGQCLKGNGHIPCESGVYDLRLYRDGQLVKQTASVATSSINSNGSNWREQLQQWRESKVVKTRDGHQITVATGPQEVTFTGIRLPQHSESSQVEFTAYAFNEDRVKSATSEPKAYSLEQPRQGVKRRAYVIMVGVDATSDPSLRLSFAPNGAREVGNLLNTRLGSQYEIVPVPLISEYKKGSDELQQDLATKENIQKVLNLLSDKGGTMAQHQAFPNLQSATPDDLVVLYIASHGYADPSGKFYVIPSDIGEPAGVSEERLDQCLKNSEQSGSCQAAQDFLHHTISSDELTEGLQGIDAGQMVLILDSCHSAAVSGPNFKPGPMGDASFGQLSYDKGMLVLAATQAENVAWGTLELEDKSLLTYALTNQHQGGGAQPFDLRLWLSLAERQVPELYQRFVKAGQQPSTPEKQLEQEPALFDFTRRHPAVTKNN
jgi:WD40 repeat protein